MSKTKRSIRAHNWSQFRQDELREFLADIDPEFRVNFHNAVRMRASDVTRKQFTKWAVEKNRESLDWFFNGDSPPINRPCMHGAEDVLSR